MNNIRTFRRISATLNCNDSFFDKTNYSITIWRIFISWAGTALLSQSVARHCRHNSCSWCYKYNRSNQAWEAGSFNEGTQCRRSWWSRNGGQIPFWHEDWQPWWTHAQNPLWAKISSDKWGGGNLHYTKRSSSVTYDVCSTDPWHLACWDQNAPILQTCLVCASHV